MPSSEIVSRLILPSGALLLLTDSLLRFCLLALRFIKPAPAEPPKLASERGCVLLIAAHNEAGTIGPTVQALKARLAEWPGSSLWVVADRCDDATAEEAEAAGAMVAKRAEGRLGKGAVIAWWLTAYEPAWRQHEFILILDADSRLAPGSLEALRRSSSTAGADTVAFQAFVAPDAGTHAGRLAGWSEVLMQRIDDEARRRCGWSVPLRGTGMAFRGAVLADLAPQLHTLAEDLELDVLLAARRQRVAFVPAAQIYDPKPQQSAGASRQRARWFQGQLQVLGDYPREIVVALRKGGLSAWLLLIPLLLRPKVLFIGLRLALLLLSAFFPVLFWLALTGLASDALYYLAGAAVVDNPRRYLLDLLAAPRYVAMWGYGLGLAFIRRGQRGWLRAGR